MQAVARAQVSGGLGLGFRCVRCWKSLPGGRHQGHVIPPTGYAVIRKPTGAHGLYDLVHMRCTAVDCTAVDCRTGFSWM